MTSLEKSQKRDALSVHEKRARLLERRAKKAWAKGNRFMWGMLHIEYDEAQEAIYSLCDALIRDRG